MPRPEHLPEPDIALGTLVSVWMARSAADEECRGHEGNGYYQGYDDQGVAHVISTNAKTPREGGAGWAAQSYCV